MHESGICLVLGLITGFIIKQLFGELPEFDSQLFFNFMLPFLILGAGYNLKRRRFFRNIGPILMLGVVGTLISFIVIGLFIYAWSDMGLILKNGKSVNISMQEALFVGATLSATDVVCTLALVKEHRTPRLHSILFGEAATNDAIAILLLDSLHNVTIDKIDAASVFEFIGEFLYNCTASVLLGLLFGALCALATKYLTGLQRWKSKDTALLLYISWVGYAIAELCNISGVICLLVCSIVSGHYAMFNLSPNSQVVSAHCFHFIGDAAEALVFAYLGLTAYAYDLFSVPIGFLFLLFLSTVIARFSGTYLLSYLCSVVTCKRHNLGFKNLSIVWVGGIIRGGISFALILTINTENAEILQRSVLALVILGTLLMGTILPLWVRWVDLKEVSVSIVAPLGNDSFMSYTRPERGWLHNKWREVNHKYIRKALIRSDALAEMNNKKKSWIDHNKI